MDHAANLTELRRRLAETIAWCCLHVSVNNPKDCLRSSALRPENLHPAPTAWGGLDYDWGRPEENRAVVSALAEQRATQLRTLHAYSNILPPDLAGGRLLVAAPEESDHCCLSEPESDGFIDALDVPAWDTWVCYLHEPNSPDAEHLRRTQEAYRSFYNKSGDQEFVDWQPPAAVSYLLCWVPPEFLTLVEEGIKVNPVECFFWATDYKARHYNTPTLRELEAAGLMR